MSEQSTFKTIRAKEGDLDRVKKIKNAKNFNSLTDALSEVIRSSEYFKKDVREIRFNEWIGELDDIVPHGIDDITLTNLKALLRHYVLNEGDISVDILRSLCPDSHKVVSIEEENNELGPEQVNERIEETG